MIVARRVLFHAGSTSSRRTPPCYFVTSPPPRYIATSSILFLLLKMAADAAHARPAARSRSAHISLLSLLLVSTLLPLFVSGMGVISIDYGTSFMKAALVKPGLPFDVVLSKESKRKVPSVVGWKKYERLFGSDAENAATKFPKDTFAALKGLLGREWSEEVESSRQAAVYNTDLRSLPGREEAIGVLRPLKTNDDSEIILSVEELVGMQLGHMKQLAEATAGEEVKVSYPGNIGSFGGLDVVLTVPGFFTAPERRAIYDAAQLTGMKPRLVSDGAAGEFVPNSFRFVRIGSTDNVCPSAPAATSYALTRTFPKKERHMFYDAGAGSTRATIVEFSTEKVQPDSVHAIGTPQKEVTVVEVVALGWDRQAGGLELDLILRKLLADKFSQTPAGKALEVPVEENDRAMARLLKEAVRVKHVLSANTVATSGIEGLAEDKDWRGKIDREEFEAAVDKAGLTPRFTKPIHDALARAGLKIADLDSVVLVGGSTRVPLVLAALREAGVPEEKVAQNVNADEAAVMGAAFYGASFNPQFRMKEIRAYDANPYPVLLRDPHSPKPELLFGTGSFREDTITKQYGAGVQEDFVAELEYDVHSALLADGFSNQVAYFNVSGISSALADLKAQGEISGVETDLNVTFVSKPLGTYAVQSAVLNVKPKVKTGLAGVLKGFFGVGGSSEDEEKDADGEAGNSTSAKKPVEAKDKLIRLSADTVVQGAYKPMDPKQLKRAKEMLYLQDRENERRSQREEARNLLEGFIYRVRDLLEESTEFQSVSKKQEREKIRQKADDINTYLSKEGDKAELSALKLKRTELESLVKPIEVRLSEAGIRDEAVKSFQAALDDAQTFVNEAQANLTHAIQQETASKYSKTELDSLVTSLSKDQKFFDERTALQTKTKKDEDPAFVVEELHKRKRKFSETIRKLKKRKIAKTRPAKKQPPTAATKEDPAEPEPATTPEPADDEQQQQQQAPPPPEQQEAPHSDGEAESEPKRTSHHDEL